MSLKTKIIIANIVGIIFFIVGMALLLFTPLASIFTVIGAYCVYLVGKWRKQEKAELGRQGVPITVPTPQAIKSNLLIAIIGIGIALLISTPLFLYFSPQLQKEESAFIGGILVSYALITFILWRKGWPSKR